MMKRFWAGSIGVVALLATPAGATVLVGTGLGGPAINYGVSVSARANKNVSTGAHVQDDKTSSSTADAPGNFLATASRSLFDGTGELFARASVGSDLRANFTSAAAASLTFGTSQIARATGSDGYAQATSSYFFRYDFRTTEAATFELLHNFGSNMGCCGNRIELWNYSGSGAALPIFETFSGTVAPGTLTASLVAGGRYMLQISRGTYIGSDAAFVRGAGTDTKAFTDRLSFSIKGAGDPVAAVPEPATWGMMILGFGAIGAAMRRRRQAPARLAA